MNSLKLKRLSTMPNKNGSYAYSVENADQPNVAEFLDKHEGVYKTESGMTIIYSRSRVGKTNVASTVSIREVEQRVNGEGTGRMFINIVDTSADLMAELGSKYQMAERFGAGFAAAFAGEAAKAIIGEGKTAPAPVAAPARAAAPALKVEETPANDTPPGPDGTEKVLENKQLAGQEQE